MAKLHFGTENGAESERSANNSRGVGMQQSHEEAFSAGSVSIVFSREKTEDKRKEGHTLQEAQEQELQLPEQQLQAQGDMVKRVGLKTKVLKVIK